MATNLPSWAKTVLRNDFEGDTYWYDGIESEMPEAYYAISNLQQRPSDIHEYYDSIAIYNKYIDDIRDYYGGQDKIDAYFAEYEEYPPGYVPPPKLRLKKKNIGYVKSGVVPQRIGAFIKPVSSERILSNAEEKYTPQVMDEVIVAKPKKGLKKVIKKSILRDEHRSHNDIYGQDLNSAASYDIIKQYYNTLSDNGDNSLSNVEDISVMSIDEIAHLYDVHDREENTEWVPANEDSGRILNRNRILVSKDIQNTSAWAKTLHENGFDNGLRKMAKTMSESERSYIERSLGISIRSKKELKKKKKTWDKYKKNIENSSGDKYRSIAHALSNQKSGVNSDISSKVFDDIVKRRK